MGDTVKTERLQTDVLIIGGGTAGCYAALTIAEQNDAVSVLICEKAHIKRSGCLAAGAAVWVRGRDFKSQQPQLRPRHDL